MVDFDLIKFEMSYYSLWKKRAVGCLQVKAGVAEDTI